MFDGGIPESGWFTVSVTDAASFPLEVAFGAAAFLVDFVAFESAFTFVSAIVLSVVRVWDAKVRKRIAISNRMTLESLHLLFFKNYDEATLAFSPHINCFVGDNGSGKTNLLDAIHYLSLTNSAFTSADTQSIKQGAEFFVVKGHFQMPPTDADTIQCSLRLGQKKVVTRNKQAYERMADHIGRYPVVLISPYDTDLIRQGSEERRKYFDSLISQLDHELPGAADYLLQPATAAQCGAEAGRRRPRLRP